MYTIGRDGLPNFISLVFFWVKIVLRIGFPVSNGRALSGKNLTEKISQGQTHIIHTKLPIFYTLSILIVSEHIAGILGLIVGIPVFMFILDIIEVPYINKNNQ